MMKKVTLDNIADRLGVSKFAVSRALSGKDGVSEELRLRIISAAREMGYQRTNSTAPTQPIIHVIFAEHDPVNSELWMQMQNGIQQEASAAGYQLQTIWAPAADKVGNLVASSYGVVLVGQHAPPLVEAIANAGCTMVRLGWVRPLEDTDQIGGADHEAGKAVGEYLLSRGHRRITFVHGTRVLRGHVRTRCRHW
jgi:LacI family transcriptional regulator